MEETTKRPLISIITAVRNGADHLEQAIRSIESQEFRNFEYIIVDGCSTDGTIDIIKRHEKSIASWVSEPDGGISDAFNKGVLASNGSVLLFLGADDYLHSDSVLSRVASMMGHFKKPYFFYGDVNYVYAKVTKQIHQNYTFRKFCRYDCIPHQAMFLDRWFFNKFGLFDLSYRRAMDYEHIGRFIKEFQPEYIDLIVADMRREGVSSDPLKAHEEMDRARLKHGLASNLDVMLSGILLRCKLLIARCLGLNW